ncbi:MAG: hypothetical protein BWY68_00661 [bacterium ADurb.Bin400]|nr:MAG: hypothetical protein BWY68_00661 [bacterium ADurb.Bin400]
MPQTKHIVSLGHDKGQEKPILEWQGLEYEIREVNARRVVQVIAVALIVSVVFVLADLPSAAYLVMISAVVSLIIPKTPPKKVRCFAYNEGVVVGDQIYHYNQIKHFTVSAGSHPHIKLQLIGKLAGEVTVPLPRSNWIEVQKAMAEHLPEEQRRSFDLSEAINNLFQF